MFISQHQQKIPSPMLKVSQQTNFSNLNELVCQNLIKTSLTKGNIKGEKHP